MVISAKMRKQRVLGGYGKSVDGAVCVNWSFAGSANCDDGCKHKHLSADGKPGCYAIAGQNGEDRKPLLAKLHFLHGWHPALVAGKALVELRDLVETKGKAIPWVRISTFGSVPQPEDTDQLFIDQLRAFLAYAKQHDIPVHFPVETGKKAAWYRRQFGDLVEVRASLQSDQEWLSDPQPASYVAGEELTGPGVRAKRVAAARDLAAKRRALTGRKCVVCPAVVTTWKRGIPKATRAKNKCGRGGCTACERMDVVYPHH
jgi:hypothetical protein